MSDVSIFCSVSSNEKQKIFPFFCRGLQSLLLFFLVLRLQSILPPLALTEGVSTTFVHVLFWFFSSPSFSAGGPSLKNLRGSYTIPLSEDAHRVALLNRRGRNPALSFSSAKTMSSFPFHVVQILEPAFSLKSCSLICSGLGFLDFVMVFFCRVPSPP